MSGEPNLQISVDTTASADVPSSVTKTTDTTSTLQPPPPPLQKPTVHRDITNSSRFVLESLAGADCHRIQYQLTRD
ncbi:hypothetical protein Tco_1183584 [Tanacetum coccineum]